MSVAVVHEKRLLLAKGYGKASVEFDVPATAATVYPISSASKMFAGLLAVRLSEDGVINLDAPIGDYLDGVPADKNEISVRHLLQHTHGLEDFYQSDEYFRQTGLTVDESSTDQLAAWSLGRPLLSAPGEDWAYSLAGYVLLARILEHTGDDSYASLVERHVFGPLGIDASYGGSDAIVPGRNPVLYELADDQLVGHIVDFPRKVWAAGGLNFSVLEMAKLFSAVSGDEFLGTDAKKELWGNVTLSSGEQTHYGLGWFSYRTSRGRWVVGHEGGGASWVIYYPDTDLAVIALSNMSGARADSLPFDIARAAFANGVIPEVSSGYAE
jgi:CubicO group peptidase (beta-lactamase class C family)